MLAGEVDRQWRPMLVNQDVHLGAALVAVGRVTSRGFDVQRGRDRFAVHCLPLPAHAAPSCIEAGQGAQDILPDALPLPRFKPFVQHAAGDGDPIAMHSFPLAAGPEHIPDTINGGTIVRS